MVDAAALGVAPRQQAPYRSALGAPDTVNTSQFEALLRATFDTLLTLTRTKGAEYAHDADQLANFRRLSDRLGLPAEAVLMVYLTKHLDSVESYIREPRSGLSEPIESRIDDAILYLCLLKALIHDSSRQSDHSQMYEWHGGAFPLRACESRQS